MNTHIDEETRMVRLSSQDVMRLFAIAMDRTVSDEDAEWLTELAWRWEDGER